MRDDHRPRLLLIVIALLACVGCQAFGAGEPEQPGSVTAPPITVAEALRLLDGIEVRVEDTGAHYRRDDWLKDWAYDPATKCNTRERVLIRDGDGETVDDKCRSTCPRAEPEPACWTSLYDGAPVYTPTQLQIDHVVSLKEATRSGTRGWSADKRKAFANDVDNLIAVSSSSNGRKGADDPGRSLPQTRGAWCRVGATTVMIKSRYGMHVDQEERDMLVRMLDTCPTPAPTSGDNAP